jgi:hypothetical protein
VYLEACIAEWKRRHPVNVPSLAEMDFNKMLAELRAELARIEEVIMALERIARGQGKRRGRPPGSKNKPKPDSA